MHVATTGLYLAVVYVWSVTRITSFRINVFTITPSAQYCSVFYELNCVAATSFGLCLGVGGYIRKCNVVHFVGYENYGVVHVMNTSKNCFVESDSLKNNVV
jgi:hypothetical protein